MVVLPLGSIVLVACRRDSKSDVLPLWYGPNQDRAPGGSFVGIGHLAGPPLSGGELFTRARPFLHDGSDPGGCRVTREYCRQGWARWRKGQCDRWFYFSAAQARWMRWQASSRTSVAVA